MSEEDRDRLAALARELWLDPSCTWTRDAWVDTSDDDDMIDWMYANEAAV